MGKHDGEILIENAELRYLNFAGEEGTYNAKGARNFQINLPAEVADMMRQDGFNVKKRKPREGDDPNDPQQDYIQVKVGYKYKPPRITMIGDTTGNRTNLTEEMVAILDDMDITKCDLVIRPREYDINGNQGISCYLKQMFVTIHEDYLDLKYGGAGGVPVPAMEGTDDSPPWEE